jgi:hypothetical protein
MRATQQGLWLFLLSSQIGCGIGNVAKATGAPGAVAAADPTSSNSIDPNFGFGSTVAPVITTPIFDPNMWLHTQSKAQDANVVQPGIYRQNGSLFTNRGVVVADPRSCDNCSWTPPTPYESIARIDLAVDTWHANLIRLTLESHHSPTEGQATGAVPRLYWKSVLDDPNYLQSLVSVVNHIGSKPGVYVLLSLWYDQSLTQDGKALPTLDSPTSPGSLCAAGSQAGAPSTNCVWQKLAQTFASYPYVLFGMAAEPVGAANGSDDANVLARYNGVAQTIRDVEDRAGVPYHILTASGTRSYGRSLAYYAQTQGNGNVVYNTLSARNGNNIAYETHPFSASSDFSSLFADAAQYLPILIGDFGPQAQTAMGLADCDALISQAAQHGWPFTARAMAPNCDSSVNMVAYPDAYTPGNVCDGSSRPHFIYTPWGSNFLISLINLNP